MLLLLLKMRRWQSDDDGADVMTDDEGDDADGETAADDKRRISDVDGDCNCNSGGN